MSAKVFSDTNMLVHAFGQGRSLKKKLAVNLIEECLTNNSLFISTQVLGEFINVYTKKLSKTITFKRISELIFNLEPSGFNIAVVYPATILSALQICVRYKFSHWDALIIAAALENGCSRLISEDLTPGQKIKNLTTVNPFLS